MEIILLAESLEVMLGGLHRKKEIIPAVVIPWELGIWLGRFAKLGHMAVIITWTTSPPLAV